MAQGFISLDLAHKNMNDYFEKDSPYQDEKIKIIDAGEQCK